MKNLKALLVICVILALSLLPLLSANATEITTPVDIVNGGRVDLDDPVMEFDISEVKNYLAGKGGRVTLLITHNAPLEASVTYRVEYSPTNDLFPDDLDGKIKAKVIFTIGDPDAITELKITNASLRIVPNSVAPTPNVTATPTGSLGPNTSPTGSLDPNTSPTGSLDPNTSPTGSLDPNTSPTGSAGVSPSPTDIITEITPSPTPTARPKVTPEPTKDTYKPGTNQTQAPPTLSLPPDTETLHPDQIFTPVPDEPFSTAEPTKKGMSSMVSSFLILFIILVVLLAADIALIIWRKHMCYGEVNNGVTRRKVVDLTDGPEELTEEVTEEKTEEPENNEE